MATVEDSDGDCNLSKEEMADLDVSVIASSAKKHKRGLKTMKKKKPLIDLNTSVRRKRLNSSLTKKLNLSINSVQKQSLRANNRALAVNLERTKQELRMALEMNQELRREVQEKDMRIVTLERVSGLRNDEIEEEVLRRVEQSHSTLRGILTAMGESLFAASHNLSDALHHCVQSSRRSTIGSRKTSSVGNASNLDLEVDINGPAYQRSIYAQTQGSSLPLPMEQVPRSDEGALQLSLPAFTASSHDMSVIAEQTMCLDDIEPLSDLDSSLLNQGISEEADVDLTKPQVGHKSEKSKAQVSKLPQRVPRKEKTVVSVTESSERSVNEKEEGVMVESESLKAGEIVSKENSKPPKKERKGKHDVACESVNRRGTFVVADVKDLELDPKNTRSSRLEEIGTQEEVEDDAVDRRKTFVKPGDQMKEDDVKNDRRGTFVVPPNPVVDEIGGREELEPMEDEDQTRYFNTDMEMTEVFNFTQQISTESINRSNESSRPCSAKGERGAEQKGTESRPGSAKGEKGTEQKGQKEKKTNTKEDSIEKKEESSKKSSGKTKESSGKPDLDLLKSKLEKIKSTDSARLSKGTKGVSEEKSEKPNERRDSDEGHVKPVVEMRVSKPGNFEYRVSRKQEDGTRQPVPQKPVSRSRSKGKVKLSKATSEVITTIAKTPGKPRNVFDFGDRTPTVTLDLKSLNDDSDKEHQKGIESKKAEKDPKSKENKNEKDVLNGKPSSEKESKIKSSKSVKDQKLLPDNPVYYVPLAKGSPAVVKEPSRQSRRSRSKPRTYREVSSDEEEMEEECEEVKGQERSKSRRRFSSGEEVERSGRRTRSQSRGRKKDVKKDEEEEDKDYEPAVAKKQRQSRGRSRTRRIDDVEEEVKVSKERASRSRTRKAVEQQENDDGKSEDSEEVKIVRKTRSRSRARSVKSRAEEMEDENEVLQEKMAEKCPDENQKESEIAPCVEKVRLSSRPFLESLRKSTDVSGKVDKEQSKAFLASLVNNKEKDKEPQTSNKHAEVLVPSSSEEEMEDKAVEDGQRMSVNESLVEDLQDAIEQVPSAPVLPEKKMKRKREELDDDKCTKNMVEDAENADVKKADENNAETKAVKKSLKREGQKELSGKEKEGKVDEKSAVTESTASDDLPAANDRLSQFVRERGRPRPMMTEEDDDITFSDFDKLYKHVSAKRATESESDEKVNKEKETVEVKTKEKVKTSEEASQENPDFKTLSVPSRKSTKSTAKSRSKKSSKKKSRDEEQKPREDQGSGKENSVEQNVSQSKKKLELLKKRLTEFDARKPSLDPLSDVTVTKSLPSSPHQSEEPDKKRPRRGGPVSYKERPLNSKIRRGDMFFE